MAGTAQEIRDRVASAVVRSEPMSMLEIVQRWTAGESTQVLAKEAGYSSAKQLRLAVKRWTLSGDGDKEYADIVTLALVARIAEADEMLEEVKGADEIARWREVRRFAMTDLERRRPHLYGQKQTNVNVTAVVADAGLVGAASELLALARERKLPALTEKVVEEVPVDAAS